MSEHWQEPTNWQCVNCLFEAIDIMIARYEKRYGNRVAISGMIVADINSLLTRIDVLRGFIDSPLVVVNRTN